MNTKDFGEKIKDKFLSQEIIPLFGNTDVSKITIAPYRDWRILGVGFFIMLVLSFGFNMYILFQVNNDNFAIVPQNKNQEVSFNQEGLMHVIDTTLARAQVFDAMKTQSIKISDPSL